MRTDQVRVFLEVPEVEAAKVDLGDSATLRIQALDGAEFKGQVTRTSWALDEENRTLTTEIDLDNADGRLRPGMYATTTVQLAESNDAIALPVAAVARKDEATFCFVIRNGKAIRTPIKLGLRVGGEWEIAEGLSGDETVALAKAETLQDGQKVEAVKAGE
jgi:RND family efflux transporter MFP subunit